MAKYCHLHAKLSPRYYIENFENIIATYFIYMVHAEFPVSDKSKT